MHLGEGAVVADGPDEDEASSFGDERMHDAARQHAVATGSLLPASVPLVCVDINPAMVTRLADRGTGQGRGIVTDVGLFLEQLTLELVGD